MSEKFTPSIHVPIEFVTDAMPTIDTNHAAIHRGEGFSVWMRTAGLAASGATFLSFTAPADSYVHLKLAQLRTTGSDATLEIIENPTSVTGGDAFVPQNHSRTGTPKASTSTLKTGATAVDGGTVIHASYSGAGRPKGKPWL